MAQAEDNEILNELVGIKKLLIFALLSKPEVSQLDIANALGISQSQVSRLMAKPNAKEAKAR